MSKTVKLASLTALLLTGACARTPDLSVGYYQPRADMKVRVLQTVDCDAANHIVSAGSAVATIGYSSDPARRETVRIRKLDGEFANSDIGFNFYDDGRLKGLNAESTGNGEEILKSAITLATAVFALDGSAPPTWPAECAKIKSAGGGKPLTLAYDAVVPFAGTKAATIPLTPDLFTSPYYTALKAAVGRPCITLSAPEERAAAGIINSGSNSGVRLKLRQPAVVKAEVYTYASQDCSGLATSRVWSAPVLVPSTGRTMSCRSPPRRCSASRPSRWRFRRPARCRR